MLRLELLPADYGDCLWLQYGDPNKPRVVLIDGGPDTTYETFLRPRIEQHAKVCGGTARIELLVVTHIDNDHIVGVLKMLEDDTLDVDIGEVWYNGWDQLGSQKLGVSEGIRLSTAIADRGLRHNTTFGGKAAAIASSATEISLEGGLSLTLLSPGPKQIERLREKWLSVLAAAATKKARPSDKLGATEMKINDLKDLASKKFKADPAPANGSSIAFLAKYEGQQVLLAADSFPKVVTDSLSNLGHTKNKPIPLAAYKMSHHGSQGNNSNELLGLVQCSNYLFSTSGNSRSRHPHDECVARVLVNGGEKPRLHFNYARQGVFWKETDIKDYFEHGVVEPQEGRQGLAIDIA